ncbi:hypothetical protein ACUOA8_20845, partial [Escherichia sp. SS-MK2]
MTAGEVAAHFGWPLEKARNALEQLFCYQVHPVTQWRH